MQVDNLNIYSNLVGCAPIAPCHAYKDQRVQIEDGKRANSCLISGKDPSHKMKIC